MTKKVDHSYRYGIFIRGGWRRIPMGFTVTPNFITRHYAEVLTSSQRDIVDCLFRHKREDASAVCNPSIPTIMNETALSRWRVQDDIRIMEKREFLKVKREFGKNNQYDYQPFVDYMQDFRGLDMKEPMKPEDLENENLAGKSESLNNDP